MDNEIDKMLKNGHIKRVEKVSHEDFVQPMMITVKKVESVKIALDAKSLNNAVWKNK